MKAIKRTYYAEDEWEDEEVEVSEDYDFSDGPYSEYNDSRCPAVGSNQTILSPEWVIENK